MTSEYGPLAEIVATSGCLLSAGGAIALGWKRRADWEPVEDDLPRAPQRVGSLLSALVIGLLWGNRARLDTTVVTYAAIGFGVACVLSLLVYVHLVTTMLYTKKIAVGPQKVRDVRIVGGFRVLPDVVPELRQHPRTVQQLLATRQYDPDRVWTRPSRGLAKICFVLVYLGLSTGGTVALAAASLLVGEVW